MEKKRDKGRILRVLLWGWSHTKKGNSLGNGACLLGYATRTKPDQQNCRKWIVFEDESQVKKRNKAWNSISLATKANILSWKKKRKSSECSGFLWSCYKGKVWAKKKKKEACNTLSKGIILLTISLSYSLQNLSKKEASLKLKKE